jgi:protein-tyrosine phosphatase
MEYRDINQMNEIVPHLYISNWEQSDNPNVLKTKNIKAIITLETMDKSNSILDFYKKNGIDHMYIYITDTPDMNIFEHFDETYDFINKHILKGDNVLVHCRAGVSRSATIILNYLLRKTYETNKVEVCPCKMLNNILEYVRQKRPAINPNKGFMKQLLLVAMKYQKDIDKQLQKQEKDASFGIY